MVSDAIPIEPEERGRQLNAAAKDDGEFDDMSIRDLDDTKIEVVQQISHVCF